MEITTNSIRPLIFISMIIIFGLWEYIKPVIKHSHIKRKLTNIVLFISSVVVMKIAFPFGLFALVEKFHTLNISIFSLYKFNYIYDLIITILVMDLAIYWQHRLSHMIKPIWAFHKVHHSDRNMDLSTALRFHPFEILLSGVYKLVFIAILAPRLETFLIYEVILSSMAIFNHANIGISKNVDSILAKLFVTPSFHTPHHSPQKELTNSNYGNFLSIWDRLFNSYSPVINKNFGIDDMTDDDSKSISKLLTTPFKL